MNWDPRPPLGGMTIGPIALGGPMHGDLLLSVIDWTQAPALPPGGAVITESQQIVAGMRVEMWVARGRRPKSLGLSIS